MIELRCIVVTPERTICDAQTTFVALPLYDGEIGIAPGHTAMIGRLGAGEMRISEDSDVRRYYVEGGFVEVAGEVVTVLTNRAIPAADLDEAVIQEQLSTARTRPANTLEMMAARDRVLVAGRAQLRVARRAI